MVEVRTEKSIEADKPNVQLLNASLFSVPDGINMVNERTPLNYVSFDGKGIDLYDDNKKFFTYGYSGYLSNSASDILNKYDKDVLLLQRSTNFPKTEKTIVFYDNCVKNAKITYSQSNVIMAEETINVIDGLLHFTPKVDCDSITVKVINTAEPYQLVKISSIFLGSVNVIKNIKSIGLTEETTILSDDLPANKLEFSYISKGAQTIKELDKLSVYSNLEYYGTFYVDSLTRVAKDLYEVTALDVVSIIDKETFRDWADFNTTFGSFIASTNFCIEDSPLLDYYNLYGYIPVCTVRQAVCSAAWACNFIIDSSRSDKIKFKPVPNSISSVIHGDRILENSYVEARIPISEINYKYLANTYKASPETETHRGEPNTDVVYDFEKAPREVKSFGTDSEIISYSLNHIEYRSASGTVQYTFSPVTLVENLVKITNPDATNSNKKDFMQFSLMGRSPQSGELYRSVKKKTVTQYINSSNIIHAKVRLRGERVGDLVEIETAYDGVRRGIITSMHIEFGYEDVAEIEVQEWRS